MKFLYVKFSDATYRIPAEVIADSRAAYFATHDTSETTPHDAPEWQRIYAEELEFTLGDEYELADWASNNMNWSDVSGCAVRVVDTPLPDYNDEWTNAEKNVKDLE